METCDPGWNGTVVKIVLVDTVGITGDDKQWRHIAAGIVMVLMIICGVIGKIRLHSFKIVIHVVVGGLERGRRHGVALKALQPLHHRVHRG